MDMPTRQEAIRLEHVGKTFVSGSGERAALVDVSCTLRQGEFCLIVGPSGSGKTTLLTIAAGLQAPSEGRVLLLGNPIERCRTGDLQRLRASRFGFVFQDFRLIDSLTVSQNVALVLRFAGWSRADTRRRVEALLAEFDISSLRDRYPDRLSQGEKQRVAVARAVANGAEVLFADEPTASVDTEHGLQVIRHLADHAHARNACVVAVTHDLRLRSYADRAFHLEDGALREIPAAKNRLIDPVPDAILDQPTPPSV